MTRSPRTRPRITRRTKVIIAATLSVLWLGYMVIGLAVIDYLMPTVAGRGPAGTAAFIGLLSGFFVTGFVMWAASD